MEPSISAPPALHAKPATWALNPAISIHLESGNGVVILEGTVVEVDLNDKARVQPLDAASRAKYKMPLMAMPEVVLYSVYPRVVLAWTEKYFLNNATRLAIPIPPRGEA